MTTVEACDARADCHSVFRCWCEEPGCCAEFSGCADGRASCDPPEEFCCTIPAPYCGEPYVGSYTECCYGGCVRPEDCAE